MKTVSIGNGHTGVWVALAVTVAAFAAVASCVSSATRVERTAKAAPPDYWPTNEWRACTPEEQGFDSAQLAEGLLAIKAKGIRVHSLLLIRDGKAFLDAYFYPYDGSIYHDLASVTKSFMTTLVGIAQDRGAIDISRPVLSYFPDRTVANRDSRKERITVENLASMSSGLELKVEDDAGSAERMYASPDWTQYVLDQPVVFEPGSRFLYYSPGTHLLSVLLTRATGKSAYEYAKENLFGPLGIENAYWQTDLQGNNTGGGDLCLRPRDAAKLAYLWMSGGVWDGKQIVSEEWVESSIRPLFGKTGRNEDYGYGWWAMTDELAGYLASGRDGQRILVIPKLDVIIVTTGGGFEWDEIGPYVEAAFKDPSGSLPPNPEGVKKLDAAITAVGEKPAPRPVPPLPAAAKEISDRTWIFEHNQYLIRSVRIVFEDPSEATITLDRSAFEVVPRVMRVGLDGVYRPSISGRPVCAKGSWIDEKTFMVEMDEGPGLSAFTFKLTASGDRLVWSDSAGKVTLECRPEGQ
jgi:CubicO group peptidase (beta-lactamase class C family)